MMKSWVTSGESQLQRKKNLKIESINIHYMSDGKIWNNMKYEINVRFLSMYFETFLHLVFFTIKDKKTFKWAIKPVK